LFNPITGQFEKRQAPVVDTTLYAELSAKIEALSEQAKANVPVQASDVVIESFDQCFY
jgi:hypothetical protein